MTDILTPEQIEKTYIEYPVMFHYLLELHQNGVVMVRLELNVPTGAFPAVRMSALLSLEAMLRDYGQQMGWKLIPAKEESSANTGVPEILYHPG